MEARLAEYILFKGGGWDNFTTLLLSRNHPRNLILLDTNQIFYCSESNSYFLCIAYTSKPLIIHACHSSHLEDWRG